MLLTLNKPGRICNVEVIEFEQEGDNTTLRVAMEIFTPSKYSMLLGYAVPESASFKSRDGICTMTFIMTPSLSSIKFKS